MIRVTIEDTERQTREVRVIEDYIVLTVGRYYLHHTQIYPRSGTVQLTLRREGQEGE